MKRKIILPIKYKKQIICFAKEYEKLAKPQNIKIDTPKITITASCCWRSDETYDVDYIYDSFSLLDICNKSNTILRLNKKIKRFCDKTDAFGRKFFKNKSWLWENVLWNFEPEDNEKFEDLNIKWM